MKRLLVAVAATVLMLMFALTACSGDDGESGAVAGQDGDTIRVITFFTGADQWAPLFQQVVQEYMDDNPHVTILDESLPTGGGVDYFRPRMHADAAAGMPADAALFFNGTDAQPLVESGLFVDWNPILDRYPAWRAQFNADALPAGYWDGQLVALPYIGFFIGLLYNQAILSEHGLEPPTSWDNILRAVEVLAETDIIPMANTLVNPTSQLEMILLSAVGPQGQTNFFDDSWVPAMQMFNTLYQMGAFPRDAATMSDTELRPVFENGLAAMSFNGSWVLNALRDNYDIGITSLPALPGASGQDHAIVAGFGSGWYMSINAYERGPETLNFIQFMCSPETLARFIEIGGSPAMPVQLPPDTEPLMLAAMEMVANSTAMNSPLDAQIPRDVFNTFNRELVFVAVGDMTPEEILERGRTTLAQHQD